MLSSINEANINLALQALKKDPQLTPFRASKIYKVSRRTLERRRDDIPTDAILCLIRDQMVAIAF
jgi:hypothetical protein